MNNKDTIVYLPDYAKTQLETSDRASVWARPMPYSMKPSPEFPFKVNLHQEEISEYAPLERGRFFPARTEPELILERMTRVVKEQSQPMQGLTSFERRFGLRRKLSF